MEKEKEKETEKEKEKDKDKEDGKHQQGYIEEFLWSEGITAPKWFLKVESLIIR
jgi:hypothetical protein